MIDYIKYMINGIRYDLVSNGDGTWSKDRAAPSVAGNYSLTIEISENGIITYIDSSDQRYNTYLDIIVSTERVAYLENLVPDHVKEIEEFKVIYNTENLLFDKQYADIEKVKSDIFIVSASKEAIERREKFIGIKGQGVLEQRKSFLISLNRKGNKLSEISIKNITNAITGSDCIVTFFASDELVNPEQGFGYLRVQVLSPDVQKNYRYEDIARALRPLIPSHIKLAVIKYFATWDDIYENHVDWITVLAMENWQAIKDYIPPQ